MISIFHGYLYRYSHLAWDYILYYRICDCTPQENSIFSVFIIGILILISALLTFIQDYKASQAAEQLLSFFKNTSIVLREDAGQQKQLFVSVDIMPAILISPGW